MSRLRCIRGSFYSWDPLVERRTLPFTQSAWWSFSSVLSHAKDQNIFLVLLAVVVMSSWFFFLCKNESRDEDGFDLVKSKIFS